MDVVVSSVDKIHMHPETLRKLLLQRITPLVWTDDLPACEEVRYDHCMAQTPFGRILITWKSWKEYPEPTIDECPWSDAGDYSVHENDASESRKTAERLYRQYVLRCFGLEPEANNGGG